ncbi:hypothetical protein [Caulobacter sp. UC70_42]|uniref:hypothetical protein n=1 Tax=Caulobacter sp. UC70_42 TaxID=3374551 RepID=UPI0037568D15
MPKQPDPVDDSSAFQAASFGNHSNVVAFPLTDESAAGEVRVDRINQFAFLDLGKKLQALSSAPDATVLSDRVFAVLNAKSAMSDLLSGKPVPLGVSRAKAEALGSALEKLIAGHLAKEGGGIKWDADIPDWRWHTVTVAVTAFETVFSEEMREADTYRVPTRGIYSTSKLIDAADETFPEDLRPIIPEKTRLDWCAAGRCLAFNLLSASGFHVARAVEGTVESYYQLATGKQKTLNSWNDYIKALEPLVTAPSPDGKLQPSAKVIGELKQMKDDYRNPIVHPRVVLSEPDARMLFANGESVIIAMAQEIRDVQQATPINALLSLVSE